MFNWVYDQTVDAGGKTYHVWVSKHKEGYTAYAVTHQPVKGGYIKPIGNGHYTNKEYLEKMLGVALREPDEDSII